MRVWHSTGIEVDTGAQYREAEKHHHRTLRRAQESPVIMQQPNGRRWCARMLIDRDGPGVRETARQLVTEAIAMYREVAMPKHGEIAEVWGGKIPSLLLPVYAATLWGGKTPSASGALTR